MLCPAHFLTFFFPPDKREQERGCRQQDLKEQVLSRPATTGGGLGPGGTAAKQQTAPKSVFSKILLVTMDCKFVFLPIICPLLQSRQVSRLRLQEGECVSP